MSHVLFYSGRQLLEECEVDLVDMNVSKGLIFTRHLRKDGLLYPGNWDLLLRCMREAVYFGEDVLPLMKQAYATKIRRFVSEVAGR